MRLPSAIHSPREHTTVSFLTSNRFFARATVCFLFSLAGFGSLTSYAHNPYDSRYLTGTWRQDENGWWFSNSGNPDYYTSSWGEYRENSYYFDEDGYMATGWRYLDGRWYYFNPYEGETQGAMMKGWILDEKNGGWFYTNQSGIMATGWRKIDGYWYYFNPGPDGTVGLMAVSRMVDNAYVDSDGRMNESVD